MEMEEFADLLYLDIHQLQEEKINVYEKLKDARLSSDKELERSLYARYRSILNFIKNPSLLEKYRDEYESDKSRTNNSGEENSINISAGLKQLIELATSQGDIKEKAREALHKLAEIDGIDGKKLDIFINGLLRENKKRIEEEERNRIEEKKLLAEKFKQQIKEIIEERRRLQEKYEARLREEEEKRNNIKEKYEKRIKEIEEQRNKLQEESNSKSREEERNKREQREIEIKRKEEEAQKRKEVLERWRQEDPYSPSNAAAVLSKKIHEIVKKYGIYQNIQENLVFSAPKEAGLWEYKQYIWDKKDKLKKIEEDQEKEIKGAIDTLYVPINCTDVLQLLKMFDPLIRPNYTCTYGPSVKKAMKEKYKVCMDMAKTYFFDEPNFIEFFAKKEKEEEEAQKRKDAEKQRAREREKKAKEQELEESRQTASRLKKEVENAMKARYSDTYLGDDIIVVSSEKRRTKSVCAVIEGFKLPTDKKDLIGVMEMLEPYSNKKVWENQEKWDKKIAESYFKKFNEGLELIKQKFSEDKDLTKFFPNSKNGFISKIFG